MKGPTGAMNATTAAPAYSQSQSWATKSECCEACVRLRELSRGMVVYCALHASPMRDGTPSDQVYISHRQPNGTAAQPSGEWEASARPMEAMSRGPPAGEMPPVRPAGTAPARSVVHTSKGAILSGGSTDSGWGNDGEEWYSGGRGTYRPSRLVMRMGERLGVGVRQTDYYDSVEGMRRAAQEKVIKYRNACFRHRLATQADGPWSGGQTQEGVLDVPLASVVATLAGIDGGFARQLSKNALDRMRKRQLERDDAVGTIRVDAKGGPGRKRVADAAFIMSPSVKKFGGRDDGRNRTWPRYSPSASSSASSSSNSVPRWSGADRSSSSSCSPLAPFSPSWSSSSSSCGSGGKTVEAKPERWGRIDKKRKNDGKLKQHKPGPAESPKRRHRRRHPKRGKGDARSSDSGSDSDSGCFSKFPSVSESSSSTASERTRHRSSPDGWCPSSPKFSSGCGMFSSTPSFSVGECGGSSNTSSSVVCSSSSSTGPSHRVDRKREEAKRGRDRGRKHRGSSDRDRSAWDDSDASTELEVLGRNAKIILERARKGNRSYHGRRGRNTSTSRARG